MAPDERVSFTDEQRRMIEAVAKQRGITFEEAANDLIHEGLDKRVRRRIKRGASASVKKFRRKK